MKNRTAPAWAMKIARIEIVGASLIAGSSLRLPSQDAVLRASTWAQGDRKLERWIRCNLQRRAIFLSHYEYAVSPMSVVGQRLAFGSMGKGGAGDLGEPMARPRMLTREEPWCQPLTGCADPR
jgi:hypothetical protein